MKSRLIALVSVVGLTLALAFLPQLRAQAKTCYDSSKNVIPCPQSNYIQTQQAKKALGPTATKIPPTDTPTPTSTDTPTPTPTDIPNPQQPSALIAPSACPSPVAAVSNGSGQTPPAIGGVFSFFPLLLGGGGLLGGILIGLLVGSFVIGPSMNRGTRSVNGDGIIGPERGWNGPITRNVNGDGIVGPDRGWNGPITTPGNDKFDKWQKGLGEPGVGGQDNAANLWSKHGDEAGAVDMFHKGQDTGIDWGDHSAAKSGGTFDKQDAAGYNEKPRVDMDDWERGGVQPPGIRDAGVEHPGGSDDAMGDGSV